MPNFRQVELPPGIEGMLFLHSMPGRHEDLASAWREIEALKITRIVSLAGIDEIHQKSPDYALAVEADEMPCDRDEYPIPDFGVPADRAGFWEWAGVLATRLQRGERLLVHCGAGFGRTGTVAICILLALGLQLEDAKSAVAAAHSEPEKPEQRELVAWCAERQG